MGFGGISGGFFRGFKMWFMAPNAFNDVLL